MGDFNAKVGRREPYAMSFAVGLYGLGETNEAGEQLQDFCLKHELTLAERRCYYVPLIGSDIHCMAHQIATISVTLGHL